MPGKWKRPSDRASLALSEMRVLWGKLEALREELVAKLGKVPRLIDLSSPESLGDTQIILIDARMIMKGLDKNLRALVETIEDIKNQMPKRVGKFSYVRVPTSDSRGGE